jgi:predicted esterase
MDRAASDAAFEREIQSNRAPLLFISAEQDEIIPSALCAKNAKAYRQPPNDVDYIDFKSRGHFICGQSGWDTAPPP